MWSSAFRITRQRITFALLCKPVLPHRGRAFERVSAAIAVRTALQTRTAEQTLLFLVPEANASCARYVTAALMVGNHGHTNGDGELPAQEARPLFKGDVLLITAAVSECKEELHEVHIGSYNRLKDYWEVIPLSKYTAARAEKPRVFLANPGWVLSSVAGRRFGAVVIDASHPRTIEKLPELIRIAEGCSSFRIAVAPPVDAFMLSACGYPAKSAVWLWDPQAITEAEAAIGNEKAEPYPVGERALHVCDSDPAADSALASLHRQLAVVTRDAGRRHYPGLQQAWSIYNRLRHLAVPLAHLEQAAANTWSGGLRERMDALVEVDGHGDPLWDSTWPAVTTALKEAYSVMLGRNETAKFWAVASRVGELLAAHIAHVRIVCNSTAESVLLLEMLEAVVDGFVEALSQGRLEVITGTQEARLVAEGHVSQTLLLGPRMSRFRYLDAYPSRPVDEFVYPYEVEVELAAQQRMYGGWAHLLDTAKRVALLGGLGLTQSSAATPAPPWAQPRPRVIASPGHKVKLTADSSVSSGLDIDLLAEDGDSLALNGGVAPLRYESQQTRAGDIAEVTFTNGTLANYYSGQSVDVFFSATTVVQRERVIDLKAGWQVISFVDGRYDSLFKRLTEVVNLRLLPKERIALALWQRAKEGLAKRHRNKRALYVTLRGRGLASGYETFTTWFRDGEEGVLAPQQFDEFEVLAKESAAYTSAELLKATFEAVQRARGRNRASGRMLCRFLRAAVSGEGYDDALESARKLDTALGDVLAAVEVLEVKSLRTIQRRAINGDQQAVRSDIQRRTGAHEALRLDS